MTYFGLNSEYVDVKSIERLCSSYQEENIKASADLAAVSATTDLKQVKFYFAFSFFHMDNIFVGI